jgi:hypothetical protein
VADNSLRLLGVANIKGVFDHPHSTEEMVNNP